MSIMWLNYVSNGKIIKHALNGGEKELCIDNKTCKVNGLISVKTRIQYMNFMVASGMDVQAVTSQIS